MDQEKLKQWMEIAKNMHGGDFWNNIFDQEFAKQFINDQTFNSNFTNSEKQSERQHENKGKNPRTFPIIELLEGEEEVIVIIELPGVRKENVELALNGNNLMVKGSIQPTHPHLKTTYSERFYGEFQRQITLPDTITPSQLSAKFWNGILFVSYKRTIERGEIIPID